MNIKEETYGMLWGTITLAIGMFLLFMVFAMALPIAQNPQSSYDKWFPEEEAEPEGPVAAFSWASQNLTVYFEDMSMEGDEDITSYAWNFGDGGSSTQDNPEHTYASPGDYRVTLEVTDSGGLAGSTDTRVIVGSEQNDGQTFSMEDLFGGLDLDFGSIFGGIMRSIGIIILVTTMFAILVMIGGRLMMAGAHLLRPMPKSFKVNIKPKEMEVVVPSQQQYAAQSQPAQATSQQYAASAQQGQAPPPPPIASCPACGQSVQQGWKLCPYCQSPL